MSCNVPYCKSGWVRRNGQLYRCASCATGKRYPTVDDEVCLKCSPGTIGKITNRYEDKNFQLWASFTYRESTIEVPLMELKLIPEE